MLVGNYANVLKSLNLLLEWGDKMVLLQPEKAAPPTEHKFYFMFENSLAETALYRPTHKKIGL